MRYLLTRSPAGVRHSSPVTGAISMGPRLKEDNKRASSLALVRPRGLQPHSPTARHPTQLHTKLGAAPAVGDARADRRVLARGRGRALSHARGPGSVRRVPVLAADHAALPIGGVVAGVRRPRGCGRRHQDGRGVDGARGRQTLHGGRRRRDHLLPFRAERIHADAVLTPGTGEGARQRRRGPRRRQEALLRRGRLAG